MDNNKMLMQISNAVRDYGMGMSRWKREGYKGDTPPYLLAAIADLYNTTEQFFKIKGYG